MKYLEPQEHLAVKAQSGKPQQVKVGDAPEEDMVWHHKSWLISLLKDPKVNLTDSQMELNIVIRRKLQAWKQTSWLGLEDTEWSHMLLPVRAPTGGFDNSNLIGQQLLPWIRSFKNAPSEKPKGAAKPKRKSKAKSKAKRKGNGVAARR